VDSSKNSALFVSSPGICEHCGFGHGESSLSVEWIEEKDGIGWHMGGKGRIARCPLCNAMYQAVQTSIPIECAHYKCPKCHGTDSLVYHVKRIDARGLEFKFEAEISCNTCKSKKTFAKALKNILSIKKIEIKLTGISIER
jgi:rubrerythrin